MKQLILIRHAKSSWCHPDLEDMDRPLNPRGRRDAPLMGRVLAKRGFAPQRLITSPALRALRTAEAVAAALGRPESWIGLDARFYHLDAGALLKVIGDLPVAADWVACVGHNPALTDLVNRLTDQQVDNVPTCGVVEMAFETSHWKGLGQVKACRVDIDFPKKQDR